MCEPTPTEVSPLVGVRAVAAYLGISEAQLYQACRDDIVPHVKIGRRTKFQPEAIMDWVANGGSSFPGGWKKEAQ